MTQSIISYNTSLAFSFPGQRAYINVVVSNGHIIQQIISPCKQVWTDVYK